MLMELTEHEERLVRELRVLQQTNSQPIQIALFPGDDTLAEFVQDLIQLGQDAHADKHEGRLAAWVLKIADSGEIRRQQLKWLMSAMSKALSSKPWDNPVHRAENDTETLH